VQLQLSAKCSSFKVNNKLLSLAEDLMRSDDRQALPNFYGHPIT